MKKNEMSFDSFIIVESEDKKQQKKINLKILINLTKKFVINF